MKVDYLARFFKRETVVRKTVPVVHPEDMVDPKSVPDFLSRGWAYYARNQTSLAERDFRQAFSMDPRSVDSAYALGIALKALGDTEQAVEAFEIAARLLKEGEVEEHDRSEMLHRLCVGHINELKTGDWGLETVIWRRQP